MVEIQERVFQDYQSVLASVTVLYVLDQRGEEVKWFPVPSGGIRLIRPNYPNNCLTLDLSEFEELKGKLIYTIMFHFGRSTFATEVDIFLEDREVALSRNYKFTKMDFNGPRITSGQTFSPICRIAQDLWKGSWPKPTWCHLIRRSTLPRIKIGIALITQPRSLNHLTIATNNSLRNFSKKRS